MRLSKQRTGQMHWKVYTVDVKRSLDQIISARLSKAGVCKLCQDSSKSLTLWLHLAYSFSSSWRGPARGYWAHDSRRGMWIYWCCLFLGYIPVFPITRWAKKRKRWIEIASIPWSRGWGGSVVWHSKYPNQPTPFCDLLGIIIAGLKAHRRDVNIIRWRLIKLNLVVFTDTGRTTQLFPRYEVDSVMIDILFSSPCILSPSLKHGQSALSWYSNKSDDMPRHSNHNNPRPIWNLWEFKKRDVSRRIKVGSKAS